MNKLGKVVVLNGTSSSGKSTLARELQSKFEEVYLLCSLDAFWNMTPLNVPAGSKNFPRLKLALAKSVKALAITGHNVIVDIVFCGQKTYAELSDELDGIVFKMVKVDCPLKELKKRELLRGNRKVGLAESQFKNVHKGISYDVEVDTFNNTLSECAQKVIAHFE